MLLGPVVIFGLAEDVARLGKGRNPAAAFEPRIPADVIDMQMRAHHEIDVLDRKARGLQRAHIGVVGLLIPFRTLRPRLVVADATVDQDRVVRGTNDIGLKAQDQRVGGVDRPRIAQPLPVLGQEVGSQSGKHIMHRQERGLLLDEAVNGEVAGGEFEAHVALPLFRQ